MEASSSTSQSIPVGGDEPSQNQDSQSPFSEATSSLSAIDIAKGMGKKLAGLRLAHEAIMVEDGRDLMKRNRDVTYPIPDKQITEGYQPSEQPEDMHVGDIITNTYQSPPAPQPEPTTVQSVPTPAAAAPTESTLSKVAKAVAGPLVGAGLAVAAMNYMGNQDESPANPDYVNMPTLELIVPGEPDSLLEPQ